MIVSLNSEHFSNKIVINQRFVASNVTVFLYPSISLPFRLLDAQKKNNTKRKLVNERFDRIRSTRCRRKANSSENSICRIDRMQKAIYIQVECSHSSVFFYISVLLFISRRWLHFNEASDSQLWTELKRREASNRDKKEKSESFLIKGIFSRQLGCFHQLLCILKNKKTFFWQRMLSRRKKFCF